MSLSCDQAVKRRKLSIESESMFFNVTGACSVIGAIDGLDCRIKAPTEREYEFVNRKQFHSINAMVIAPPDLVAIYLNAKFPGRSHKKITQK
ncbi:hypothetical protein L596_003977 [Steinernema carpocapsae]|uniref:DDE Tnp4 domain-containing protein n=1 Tax=Steinernema carpocapsae TaxID=34508 RepID=A0A4U8UUE7_STECR|nr:hypothetical protein L596_003977 [Steinernema carpocapsae]